jgi:hypothetical protein
VPTNILMVNAEASFLAYLHYMEDLAGVIAGRYGFGADGVYQSMALHPPVRALPRRPPTPAETAALYGALGTTWERLAAIFNAVAEDVYDRQANAVVPGLAVAAVTSAAEALARASGDVPPVGDDDCLAYLSERVGEELFPYPWSAYCLGCPQLGDAQWGGSVLPGDFVSVFAVPDAGSSDARLAMLLRTTRSRLLERRFAEERQTDVRPGRTRRNLTRDHKELIAASVAPTTLFDVLDRLRGRVDRDDGEAFVSAPYDDAEARRLATATAAVTDASVAAIEAVVATIVGWDVFGELRAAWLRRTGSGPDERMRAAGALRTG